MLLACYLHFSKVFLGFFGIITPYLAHAAWILLYHHSVIDNRSFFYFSGSLLTLLFSCTLFSIFLSLAFAKTGRFLAKVGGVSYLRIPINHFRSCHFLLMISSHKLEPYYHYFTSAFSIKTTNPNQPSIPLCFPFGFKFFLLSWVENISGLNQTPWTSYWKTMKPTRFFVMQDGIDFFVDCRVMTLPLLNNFPAPLFKTL